MLVFLMAAMVAIALYRELPRVAFEAQRSKEELLIERGEQYKRAIQIFVRQNNGRYPQKIEDLENFNNRRYLRKRYKDPMTGSDEWRLIHIGPGGVFTDSLTQKPPQSEKGKFGTSVEDIAREQQEQASGAPGVTPRWGQRRASESGIRFPMQQPVEGEDTETPPGYTPPQPQEGENPAQYAGQTPVPGQPMAPGQPVPGQTAILPGQPGWRPAIVPGQALLPGQPGWQPAPIGATPGIPGQAPPQMAPPGSQVPGAVQIGSPQQPQGRYPYPQQPQSPFQPQNPVRLQPVPVQIQNQISNPQGGFTPSGPMVGGMTVGGSLQGITGGMTGGSGSGTAGAGTGGSIGLSGSNSPFTFGRRGNTMGGGGIAGIASKAEEEGIKLYNDRSKYNEWEFIYDPRKDRTNPMSALGATGIGGQTGAGQTGMNFTGTSQTGTNTNTSGQNPIFTPVGSNPPVQNPGTGPRSR